MGSKLPIACLTLATLIDGLSGDLLIRGPEEAVLEGDSVRLECMFTDPALNISRVRFEVFSKWLAIWRTVWKGSWCFYSLHVKQVKNKMVLEIPRVASFSESLFRCVSDDDTLTEPNNASQALSFKVHYLREVQFSRVGLGRLLKLPQELRVRRGDDVALNCYASSSEVARYYWLRENDDWMLPSSLLKLKGVRATDAGVYTCTAEHPTVPLRKWRNISIVVLPEDARWYESNTGQVTLASSLGVFMGLSALISVCTYRRKKKAKTTKEPIDDHSQLKPIYKGNLECLPSNREDKHLLV
ncbi:uncharacterized protein si:ch211-79k12.1 [Dunckerocampus dactyliophorus]|uniref:uncharacterized protein si:ch211-79k12.1 n=1 Tax=Dunckerocampus dactyliophorus TaxID=161453 RepID=UPI002405CC1A|nr:uncharacterized protein si:ch211-79k12.1 [Dunckerocampus dactyliophorus]